MRLIKIGLLLNAEENERNLTICKSTGRFGRHCEAIDFLVIIWGVNEVKVRLINDAICDASQARWIKTRKRTQFFLFAIIP